MLAVSAKIPKIWAITSQFALAACFFLNSQIYIHAQMLSDVDLMRVCKAMVAKTMSHDVKIMRSEGVKEGIAYVAYNRPSDNKIWKTRCKTAGEKIIWSSVDADGAGSGFGRWRSDPSDENLTFKLEDKNIVIREIYSDGSESSKDFKVD